MILYWTFICFYFFTNSNCAWSPWSNWSECLGKCEHQTRMRSRYCNSSMDIEEVHIKNDTTSCPGDRTQQRLCRTEQCTDQEKEENLITNITIACIMFVPGIIIFVIVGLKHAARETRMNKKILTTGTKEKDQKQLIQYPKPKSKADVTDVEMQESLYSSKRAKFTSSSRVK